MLVPRLTNAGMNSVITVGRESTASQSIPKLTSVDLDFPTNSTGFTDQHWQSGAGYNSAAGTYTTYPGFIVPKTGFYSVICTNRTHAATAFLAGEFYNITLFVDGTETSTLDFHEIAANISAFGSLSAQTIVYAQQGQRIHVRYYHSHAAANLIMQALGSRVNLRITEIPNYSVDFS